jgi:Na+/melibiose symporter-like transporter
MFVNVPIGLVTLVLIPRLLTESQNQNKQRRVDVLGAILVTAGLIALVYTLSQGNSSGWLSLQTIGLFVLSVVLLVAFVIVEQRSSSPLVRLGIFRLRNVTGANLINLITPGVMGSVIFVLTLFMQEVMGFNAIQMGAAFLPIALMILLISNISSRLIGRLGAKTLLVGGLGIAIVGLFLFLRISVHGSYVATMLPAFLVVGLGMGFAFPTIMITATAGVEDHEQGLAAGLFNTTQEAGAGLVLAIATAISTGKTATLMHSGETAKAALTGGFLSALAVCAVFELVALLIAIFVIRSRAISITPPILEPDEEQPMPQPVV